MSRLEKANTLVFLGHMASREAYHRALNTYNETWGFICRDRLKAYYTDRDNEFLGYYEEHKSAIRIILLDAWPANRIVLQRLVFTVHMLSRSIRWPAIIVNTHIMTQEDIDSFLDDIPYLGMKRPDVLTFVDSTDALIYDTNNGLSWALYEKVVL